MRKKTDFNMLAVYSARLLSKFGVENPTYDEWVHLKDELLDLHGSLNPHAKEAVGKACSVFIEAAHAENIQ